MLCVEIQRCPCSYFQLPTVRCLEIYVVFCSNKEHAIFQYQILQHIKKSYVFKYEHVGIPISDISDVQILIFTLYFHCSYYFRKSYSSNKFMPILTINSNTGTVFHYIISNILNTAKN